MLPEQTIPSSIAPPFILQADKNVFTLRANRFRELASDHPFSAWLLWLSALADGQQKTAEAIHPADAIIDFSPTSEDQLPHVLKLLLDYLPPEQLNTTQKSQLLKLSGKALNDIVKRNLQLARGKSVVAERDVSELIVAAAIQVIWTINSLQLNTQALAPNHTETCPCCGSLTHGSVLLAGDGKAGLRYQECCLCATRWNSVRARCTLCEQGEVVEYLSLEGHHEAVAAEVCDQCHGYTKIFFQAKAPRVQPIADDLATLALDALVGEQGYARGTPNLLLSNGTTV